MLGNANHIIQKQVFELEYANQNTHFLVQERVSRHFHSQLKYSLETLFDQLVDKHTFIRFDRLELDIGAISLKNLETELTQKIIAKLSSEIQKKLNQTSNNFSKEGNKEVYIERLNEDSYIEQNVLFFLENGRFYQLVDATSTQQIKEWFRTQKGEAFIKTLPLKINFNSLIIKRLLDFLDENIVEKICKEIFPNIPFLSVFNAVFSSEISNKIVSSKNKKRLFYEAMFISFYSKNDFSEKQIFQAIFSDFLAILFKENISQKAIFLKNMLKNIDAHSIKIDKKWTGFLKELIRKTVFSEKEKYESEFLEKTKISKEKLSKKEESILFKQTESQAENQVKSSKKDTFSKEKAAFEKLFSEENKQGIPEKNNIVKEGIYLNYAGVVLVHPFLKPFFEEFDLLENQVFKNIESQQKAVKILAYLATGNEVCEEHEMILFKVLCGMEISGYVSPELGIKQKEKEATEELLNAIKNHWVSMKNTSFEAIREGFFRREGKLEMADDGLKLTIERKTMDILLDKLPWGISLIKYKWMPQLLHINWI